MHVVSLDIHLFSRTPVRHHIDRLSFRCSCTRVHTSLSILTRDNTPGFSALRPSPEAQITSQHLLLESDDIRPTPHQNIQVWTLPLSCARPISPTMAGHKFRPRGSNSACSGGLGYGRRLAMSSWLSRSLQGLAAHDWVVDNACRVPVESR